MAQLPCIVCLTTPMAQHMPQETQEICMNHLSVSRRTEIRYIHIYIYVHVHYLHCIRVIGLYKYVRCLDTQETEFRLCSSAPPCKCRLET